MRTETDCEVVLFGCCWVRSARGTFYPLAPLGLGVGMDGVQFMFVYYSATGLTTHSVQQTKNSSLVENEWMFTFMTVPLYRSHILYLGIKFFFLK